MAKITTWDRIEWTLRATADYPNPASPDRVLQALTRYADDAGVCWPTQATLACVVFNLTPEQVQKHHRDKVSRAVVRLKQDGLITVRRNAHSRFNGGWSSEYTINYTLSNHLNQEVRDSHEPRSTSSNNPQVLTPRFSFQKREPENR